MRAKATLLTLALLLALAGCGSGGEGEKSASSSSTAAQEQKPQAKGEDKGHSQKAAHSQPKQGKGSKEAKPDPQAQRLAQSFPKPKPAPGAKELSAKAIAAGEAACKGLTPTEVKDRFYSQAQANLDPDQLQLVEELPRYEEEAPDDPNFVAGQIAATVYGAALGEAESQYGFQGCVYVLAREISGE
jgi:hypothetical protein